MQTVQLALDPSFPSEVLSDLGVIELGPALSWCEQCGIEVEPVAREEDETWILYPCHQIECSGCWDIADNCIACDKGKCQDCCDCWFCESCEVYVSSDDCFPCQNCNYCDGGCCECAYCQKCDGMFSDTWFCFECNRCENDCECAPRSDGECDCSDCAGYKGSGSSYGQTVPGWIRRGDELPDGIGDSSDAMRDHLDIDPVQAMADFYLTDYVTFVIGHRPSLRSNVASTARLRNDAMRIQSHIVARCDDAFRAYGFLAIGGELRHHRSIQQSGSIPGGRSTAWDYWTALGETVGRSQLLEDALELFGDGSWSSGYGGTAWHKCTDVLLARENRAIDAKTFVDRVFSLQHNGGSFLNKSAWSHKTIHCYDVSYCRDIGNAHAATRIGFTTLLECASEDVRNLVRDLVNLHSWTFSGSKLMSRSDKTDDHERLKDALGIETTVAREERYAIELEQSLAAIDAQYA